MLEFELGKHEEDERVVVIPVMRKGIQVGTLSLDNYPYKETEYEGRTMKMVVE